MRHFMQKGAFVRFFKEGNKAASFVQDRKLPLHLRFLVLVSRHNVRFCVIHDNRLIPVADFSSHDSIFIELFRCQLMYFIGDFLFAVRCLNLRKDATIDGFTVHRLQDFPRVRFAMLHAAPILCDFKEALLYQRMLLLKWKRIAQNTVTNDIDHI